MMRTIITFVFSAISAICSADTTSYLIGTYTDGASEGIYELSLNLNSHDVDIELLHPLDNPSFIAQQSSLLVAAIENRRGAVAVFRSDELSQVLSADAHTCHVAVSHDSQWVATANYTGGSVSVYQRDGELFQPIHTFKHHGTGANPSRQNAPHAHWVGWLNNGRLLSVDLGADKIFEHRVDNQSSRVVYQARPGDGIRHLALSGDETTAFIVNELTNSVVVARRDADGLFTELRRESLLPEGDSTQSQASHIALSSDESKLYVATRGHNSISVFAVDVLGNLSLLQRHTTGGDWPRMFLIDETHQRLLVANQNSDSVAIFSLTENGLIGDHLAQVFVDSPTAISLNSK